MRKEREASNGFSLARGEGRTRSLFQYAAESREFSLDLMMKIRTVCAFFYGKPSATIMTTNRLSRWIFESRSFVAIDGRESGLSTRSIFPTIVEECYNYGASIFYSYLENRH